MKKNYKRTCAVLLFVILFLTLSCQTTCRDCGNKPACSIENLFIDVSDLPGDQWIESGSRTYDGALFNVGVERSGTFFSTHAFGGALETIHRFENVEDSKEGFERLLALWKGLEPEKATWTQLEVPNDVSINPDEYRLECSKRPEQTGKSCSYVARYDRVVIIFSVDMIIVKNNDFFQIIEIIDEKAAACVATEE
jgi:hypothetical protein